ncbi:MAG: tetratricopeptide repeat protein, partial [Candidatus Saccharicenans sp.]
QSLIPDNPSVLTNLGILSYQLQQPQEALKCLQKAVELDSYQVEANLALGLTSLSSGPTERRLGFLKNSLRGGYRESLAAQMTEIPLPLSFQQEIYISFPPLPSDFLSYRQQTPFYQEALLQMEEKESELKKNLDTILFSGSKVPEAQSVDQTILRLNSVQAYSRLLELEGQLDFLEKEVERPLNLDLDQIISQTINQLDSVNRDYTKEEKNCLELPIAERPECLKKAREKYCQRYLEQADYFYQKFRAALVPYFDQFSSCLKTFLPGFYFWVRYLPEDQQLRKRAEEGLRVWRLYQQLWEKTFLLLARVGQPSFSECLAEPPLKPETNPEPEITLFDPFSEIHLDFRQGPIFFFLRADRLILPALPPAETLSPETISPASTIYLFPPETCGSRPVYLVIDERGKLSDLGELGPWAFTGLNPADHWSLLINLHLPEPGKN